MVCFSQNKGAANELLSLINDCPICFQAPGFNCGFDVTSVINEETELWEWGLNPTSRTHSGLVKPRENYAQSLEDSVHFKKSL